MVGERKCSGGNASRGSLQHIDDCCAAARRTFLREGAEQRFERLTCRCRRYRSRRRAHTRTRTHKHAHTDAHAHMHATTHTYTRQGSQTEWNATAGRLSYRSMIRAAVKVAAKTACRTTRHTRKACVMCVVFCFVLLCFILFGWRGSSDDGVQRKRPQRGGPGRAGRSREPHARHASHHNNRYSKKNKEPTLSGAFKKNQPGCFTPPVCWVFSDCAHSLPCAERWVALLDETFRPASRIRVWDVHKVLTGACPSFFLRDMTSLTGRASPVRIG